MNLGGRYGPSPAPQPTTFEEGAILGCGSGSEEEPGEEGAMEASDLVVVAETSAALRGAALLSARDLVPALQVRCANGAAEAAVCVNLGGPARAFAMRPPMGYADAHSGLYTRASDILAALEAAAKVPLAAAGGFDGGDAAAAAQSETEDRPTARLGGAATKALPLPRVLRAIEWCAAEVELAADSTERAARVAALVALRDELREAAQNAQQTRHSSERKKKATQKRMTRRERKKAVQLAKSEAAALARQGRWSMRHALQRQLS